MRNICRQPLHLFIEVQTGEFLASHFCVRDIRMLLRCLKVLDSELKAYGGIVKDLGKEAEKLKKTDPENATEIAAVQVYSTYILLYSLTDMTSPTGRDNFMELSGPLKGIVTLDQYLTSVPRSIHFYTHALCHIRPASTKPMAATLGASLLQSRLDYANSVYGMSASNMHKLQSAQNTLTHLVLPSLRHLSPSERLSYLHWLPVSYRIQFKIATLTYKTLATCQPSYLYNVLPVYQPS